MNFLSYLHIKSFLYISEVER